MSTSVSLRSRLPQIEVEVPARVEAAVRAGAESIASEARSRVPVRSGDLQRAIHVEMVGEGGASVVAGSRDAFYGHMVEHGTVHSPAHPFLVPAAEARSADVLRAVRDALKGL